MRLSCSQSWCLMRSLYGSVVAVGVCAYAGARRLASCIGAATAPWPLPVGDDLPLPEASSSPSTYFAVLTAGLVSISRSLRSGMHVGAVFGVSMWLPRLHRPTHLMRCQLLVLVGCL